MNWQDVEDEAEAEAEAEREPEPDHGHGQESASAPPRTPSVRLRYSSQSLNVLFCLWDATDSARFPHFHSILASLSALPLYGWMFSARVAGSLLRLWIRICFRTFIESNVLADFTSLICIEPFSTRVLSLIALEWQLAGAGSPAVKEGEQKEAEALKVR